MTRTRINVTIDTTQSGPLFDGRAEGWVKVWLDDAKRTVAILGLTQIQARLDQKLKHPTGNYQSQLRTMEIQPYNDQVITDGGVIYGPWLEGTSSRNESTRFKGYRTFRYVFQRLRKQATPVAQKKLDEYIARMN